MSAEVSQAAASSSAPSEKPSAPHRVPLEAPLESSQAKERPVLTAEQQGKYDWLLSRVKVLTEVPSTKGKEGPLTDSDKFWLTRECLLRYLRATKWHEKEAEKRLVATLSWRRDYGVEEELTPEHISPENETGKQIIVGYDKECRPCHYLNPGRQNTAPGPRQVQHLVYMVERVIDLMPPKQETLSLMINFKPSKERTNTAPGISTGREVLHILQTHYPERLGKALIINVPWVVWGFFKLITPFIDPLTREKLKFNEDMRQYVPTEQLWTDFNGQLEFEYDHSVYWPALAKLAGERRAARMARWEAGGKQIGEHEDFLVGHDKEGVAATAKPAVEAPKAEETPAPVAEAEVKEAAKTEAAVAAEPKVEEPKPAEPASVEAVTEDAAKLTLVDGAKA